MAEKNGHYQYVIVGGGPAARILNHYLQMMNPEVTVAVIRNEETIANHCSIPYVIDGTVPLDGGGLTSDTLVTQFGSELVKEKVVSGDPTERYVLTDAGTRIGYEKLVFATGSEVAVPPIPGTDLPGVLKVRHIEDFRPALRAIQNGESFVVLGAGYVGLEIASALRRLGKAVTVVEMLPHVMGDRYDPEFTCRIERALHSQGVRLHLGQSAVRIGGADKVEFVELEGGSRIETAAVVLATGVRPRVSYADEFGLETARDGVVVDEFFRTNLPDVYALGECVQTRSFVTGLAFPGKLGSTAGQMARTLGMNLSGYRMSFDGVINPACTTLFGMHFCSAGHTQKDAVEHGVPVVVGRTRNTDIYSNMPHSREISVKLVFREDDRRVIGGEMVGSVNFAGFADCLGQLIRRGAAVEDLLGMDMSTHPEMTPDPAHSYRMFAAQKVLGHWASN